MPVLEGRPWRFGVAALAATMLVGWSASGKGLGEEPTTTSRADEGPAAVGSSANVTVHPAVSTAGRTGGSAPRTTAKQSSTRTAAPHGATQPLPSSPNSSIGAAQPLAVAAPSTTLAAATAPKPSLAPAASQTATTVTPYESDAPGQKVVVVGDSRLVIEPDRIAASIGEYAPDWQLVGIFGERGATASVAPCSNHPLGPVECPTDVQVHRHTQLDALLSMTDVDAVVVVTGPNEVSARRGDTPPIWDGVPVSEDQITSGWNAALGEITACHRLWATQQTQSFVTTSPAGDAFASTTANIASGLNNWLSAAGLAGRVTTIPWGQLADDNVDAFWAAAYHPISPELWFDQAASDNLHLVAGGGGQVALGRAIGETLSRVEGTPCNVR